MFCLNGKVALITGGASGIGLCCVKELLRNDVKAVVLADISVENGKNALGGIEKEFGLNKAAFIKTDVTNKEEFENAFKFTIETFRNIDILVNNAGVLNDREWEREININVNGTINGCLLALEKYIPNYRSGDEGVVLNMCSIATFNVKPTYPIYTASKHAVLGLGRSLGMEKQYQRKQIRFLTICPGGTETPLLTNECHKRTLGTFYEDLVLPMASSLYEQPPESVARAVVEVIVKGRNGSIWVVERSEPVYEVEIPPLAKLKK